MDQQQRLQRIYETIREIPPGRVVSYGQIAELAGIRRGARQVGWALRQLPDDHDVPWHRVIRASGRIAFAAGSHAFERQCRRLRAEGVRVEAGKVDLREFAWQPDLDELLWKPSGAWDRA